MDTLAAQQQLTAMNCAEIGVHRRSSAVNAVLLYP
jgi:hypothetical protein